MVFKETFILRKFLPAEANFQLVTEEANYGKTFLSLQKHVLLQMVIKYKDHVIVAYKIVLPYMLIVCTVVIILLIPLFYFISYYPWSK